MIRRFTILLLSAIFLLVIGGCGTTAAQTRTASPTPTSPVVASTPTTTPVPGPPTPTNVPAGWRVYSGTHLTIAYPADWTFTTSQAQQGLMGGGAIFSSSQHTGLITVVETYGYSQSQLQSICHLDGTPKTLAGIQMKYVLGEGVHRTWSFVNSKGVEFTLDAFDANQSQDVQALDDNILATFRPDDASLGCSS